MACGFLSLPAELRQKVYNNLFNDEERFYVKAHRLYHRRQLGYAQRSAEFLRTCKLVHSEGLAVLYGSPTFTAEFAAELASFFNAIGANGRRHIKKLCIEPQVLPRAIFSLEIQSLGVQQHTPEKAWWGLESLQEVTVAYKLWNTYRPGLQTATTFLKRVVKSKPRFGHVLYDYMDFVREPGVKWHLEFNLRQQMWNFRIRDSFVEETFISMDVEIAESEKGGKVDRCWVLKGRDEGIVPQHRRLAGANSSLEWHQLEPIKF